MAVPMMVGWLLLFGAAVALVLFCLLYRPVAAAEGEGPDMDFRQQTPDFARKSQGGRVRVRLATFNIQGGCGQDGKLNLEAIAKDLEQVNADIIGLQEVHDSLARPRQLEWLARRLGMAAVRAPVRWRGFRRHRNNALLTRLPVGAWQRIPLGASLAVPLRSGSGKRLLRQLLCAEVRTGSAPGSSLKVLVTHLSTAKTDQQAGGRPEQLRQVVDYLLRESPAVLLGDLNTRRDDPQLSALLADGALTDALSENSRKDDHQRIDWILTCGPVVSATGVINSGASDHPLYWCDVEV